MNLKQLINKSVYGTVGYISSQDDTQNLSRNTVVEVGEGQQDENNQSNVHSQLIEDLLEDGDQTVVGDLSQINSEQNTVVHTPQLSMSSFY